MNSSHGGFSVLLLVLAISFGCGAQSEPDPVAGVDGGGPVDGVLDGGPSSPDGGLYEDGGEQDGGNPLADGGLEEDGGAPHDGGINLDGGSAPVQIPFDLDVTGAGSDRVGPVSFVNSVGQMAMGSSLSAFSYEVTQWPEYGYTLYHVLAPEPDDLNVFYLYCGYASQDSFDYVWHESFSLPMDWETASGSCTMDARTVQAQVALPSLAARPSPGELVTGFSVVGAQVSIGEGGGTIVLDGALRNAYPFEAVDCRDCASVPSDGWWELHMVLENAQGGDPCFGIVYLMLDEPGAAYFSYGFCLSSLQWMRDAAFTATWSAPEGKTVSRPVGPRHPVTGRVLRPGPRMLLR